MERPMNLDYLYKAAESGNWDVIQRYEHQLGNQLTPNNDTVLHVLSRFCDSSFAARQIIGRKCELILRSNVDKETPLHIAARKGHSHIVQAILDCIKHSPRYSYVLRSINRDGNTALHEAIKNKHREIILLLVNEDSTLLDIRNRFRRSPLYLAAENGDKDVVAIILSQKPGTPAKDGIRYSIVRQDKRNELHAAAIGNFPECVKLILRKLPHLAQETDRFGWMAIHYAARFNHHEVAREMLLSDSCRGQNEALRIAVKWGHIQAMEELLNHCPRCWSTVTPKTGKNIIHLAVEKEQKDVLNFILSKSWASELVNGMDENGDTPLHYYVATKILLGCELVNHPAVERNALNIHGLTPLDRLRYAPHQDKERKGFLKRELEKSGATESRLIVRMEDDSETQSKDVSSKERLDKISETYQVVATLILTITFTAAFTVPGGYESNDDSRKGEPIFLKKLCFKTFIILDYAALFLSWMALIGLLLHRFLTDYQRRRRNLALCGSAIIFSLVALFLSFVSGLYITLPKLGMRLWLFFFPILYFGPCIGMICNYLEEFGLCELMTTYLFTLLDRQLELFSSQKQLGPQCFNLGN